MKFSVSAVIVLLCFASLPAATPANLTALFRSGQVFLTWTEAGGATQYNVYAKAGSALSAGDLTAGNKRISVIQGSAGNKALATLTGVSGLLSPAFNMSRNVVTPLPGTGAGSATQVASGTGMVVLTTHAAGTWYYAVTAVTGGTEDKTVNSGNSAGAVTETVQPATPVLLWQSSTSLARIYLVYTDPESCNVSYNNVYAWPIWVGWKAGFAGAAPLSASLCLSLNGMPCTANPDNANNGADSLVVSPHGMADWWMGWSRTAQYDSSATGVTASGAIPTSGPVVNFIQMRIMDFLDWMIHRSADFAGKVDTNRIRVEGGSAGGAGTLFMITSYPDFFSSGHCWVAPTNMLETSWGFLSMNRAFWGMENNNAVTMDFRGWNSDFVRTKFAGRTAHSFLNTERRILLDLEGTDLPFLSSSHSGQDQTVAWPAQGKNLYTWLDSTRQAFMGMLVTAGVHSSQGEVHPELFSIKRNESYPAFSKLKKNAALPLPDVAVNAQNYYLNRYVIWSGSLFKVSGVQTQVDQTDRYEIVIARSGFDDTGNVTPRRLQQFRPLAGRQYLARNVSVPDSAVVYQTDTLTADRYGLLTFPGFIIKRGSSVSGGSRLILTPFNGSAIEARSAANIRSIRCYPEPFNPSVTLDASGLGTGSSAPVTFAVYDLSGRCVAAFASASGRVTWDASRFPSGVYPVRIACGKQAVVKRVTLMK